MSAWAVKNSPPVINNHGIIREVRPEELRGKRNSSSGRAVALDVQGNQIRVGGTVKVAEGPHKGKSATIKRMSRAQLFLYSQECRCVCGPIPILCVVWQSRPES